MDVMKITEKERPTREDAAARLHALADAPGRHNDVEFERGGMRFKVRVPDEVDFKLEIEIDDDARELDLPAASKFHPGGVTRLRATVGPMRQAPDERIQRAPPATRGPR